jgi:hypothetical protein
MGPMRSRQNQQMQLFGNYEFLFIGKFSDNSITQKDMVDLAKKNGACIVGKAKDYSENSSKLRVLIFDETFKQKLAVMMQETARIYSVNKNWLLDSLACYKALAYKEYETFVDDD